MHSVNIPKKLLYPTEFSETNIINLAFFKTAGMHYLHWRIIM